MKEVYKIEEFNDTLHFLKNEGYLSNGDELSEMDLDFEQSTILSYSDIIDPDNTDVEDPDWIVHYRDNVDDDGYPLTLDFSVGIAIDPSGKIVSYISKTSDKDGNGKYLIRINTYDKSVADDVMLMPNKTLSFITDDNDILIDYK